MKTGKFRKYFLLWAFYILMYPLFSQSKTIDSLKKLLAAAVADTVKIKISNELSYQFLQQGDYNEAFKQANAAIGFSEGLKRVHGKSASSLIGQAAAYKNIGNIYVEKGNYPEALRNFLTGLKITRETGERDIQASIHNNIGIVYSRQQNYEEALKNYLITLKITKEIGNKVGICASYNNIGLIYKNQGNYAEAMKNHMVSLKLNKEIGDARGVAYCYMCIELIYFNQENYQKALQYDLMAREILHSINDKDGEATALVGIAEIYNKLGQYKKAEDFALQSLKISEETGVLEGIKSSNEILSKIYENTGESAKAFDHYKTFVLYRDSLINDANIKKTAGIQMDYEFEMIENETKLEQERKDYIILKERARQKIIRNFIICGFILMISLAFFILRTYMHQKKANLIVTKQKEEVENKKRLIEEQKYLLDEKQKEILASIHYALRIQRALITPEINIEKNLERLKKKSQ